MTYGETSIREDETKPGHSEVESTTTYARIMCAYRHYEEKYGESVAAGISRVTYFVSAVYCMTHPHSHIPIQLAITNDIVPAISPTPMKLELMTLGRFLAMFMTPATVKPDGPTEINIPGRRDSLGSFWVIKR